MHARMCQVGTPEGVDQAVPWPELERGCLRGPGGTESASVVRAWDTKKNLHVPLDATLHKRLVAQAQRIGSPVTTVAREAIEAWTAEQERRAQHEAIQAYAEAMAGSGADLDGALEEAAARECMDATS